MSAELKVGDIVLTQSNKVYRVAFVNTGHHCCQCVIKRIKDGKEYGPLRYANPTNLRLPSEIEELVLRQTVLKAAA